MRLNEITRVHVQSFVKSSIALVIGLIMAAGCSSPKSQPIPPKAQIDSSQPQYIYVDGEFRAGGKIAWTNGMTLKDAFTAAGGLTDFASRRFRVVHPNGSFE